MKRTASALLMLALLCALCACGGQTDASEEEKKTETAYEYRLTVEPVEKEIAAEDGTLLLKGEYEFPHLAVCAVEADGCERECGEDEISAPMYAVCEAFNAQMEEYRAQSLTYFDDTASWVQEVYADILSSGGSWGDAYEDTMRLSESCRTEGGLLALRMEGYSYTGGAHPNGGSVAWCFDLNEGEFIDYTLLTDVLDEFRAAAAEEILAQICAQGMDDELFEDFADTVRTLDGAEIYFDEAGMRVIFPVYLIAPYSAGSPTFTVPYAKLVRTLNERGTALLPVSESDSILADFFEAQELWDYFDMCTMPLSRDLSFETDGMVFFRVDCDGFSTMEELREKLALRFDGAIVEELLARGIYRELDGVLYGADAARGANMLRGAAEYSVECGGTGGKVIATVEECDGPEWNAETERYEQRVLSCTQIEFPFVMTQGGARFTAFESIW